MCDIKKIYFLPVIMLQWVIRLITKAFFSFFCNLDVKGLENLDGHRGPLIFVSNHASEWDGPLIRTVMPMVSRFSPMFYVSMSKKFYINSGWRKHIYGGALFKLVGAYPVYYGLKNYKKSLQNHIYILKDGGNVTVFPEGRTSQTGEIKDFKVGAVALSHITNIPITPVFIKDTYNLTRKEFFSRKRNVTVNFGIPYRVNIPKQESNDELLKIYKEKTIELRQNILDLINQTTNSSTQ